MWREPTFILDKAKSAAYKLHDGQYRSDKFTPYIRHPEKVAELVKKYTGGDKMLMALAWAHDIYEECDCLPKVSDDRLTLDENKALCILYNAGLDELTAFSPAKVKLRDRIGKAACLLQALLTMSKEVLVVKLCDMLANTIEGLRSGRTSQIKRYEKVAKAFLLCARTDCDKRHYKLAAAIIEECSKLHRTLL